MRRCIRDRNPRTTTSGSVTRHHSFAATPSLQALLTCMPDAAAMAQAARLCRFTTPRGTTPRLATQSP